MSLQEIRIIGNQALLNALGPVGMIRYLQQYEKGHGNYTEERHRWLDQLNLDTLIEQLQNHQKRSTAK